MSFLLCFYWACRLTIFFWGGNANSWPVRGSNYGPPVPDAPTLPTLRPAKILWRTPNVRLSITAPLVCTTTTTVPASARHVQPFFPRSLQAHADVSRRWRASSPPFFANLSPPAGAREHRAKVLCFCPIMFARTPSQLFEAFECQHHPAEVSHSQLWQLK